MVAGFPDLKKMTARKADLKIRWRALRAYSFPATIIPVTCAFLFARSLNIPVDWSLFPLMLFCALLLHAGVNLLNDYYDFILGFDTAEAHGSSGLLLEKAVPPAYMLNWGRGYIAGGAAAGLMLAAARGWPLLLMGLPALAGAWFYSHRNGYKYKGLGEPCVFVLMGPLLFYGSFFTATGTVIAAAAWPALACGCLVTAILLVNNLRDLQMDSAAGFTTLPMRLGTARTKKLYAALILTAVAALAATRANQYNLPRMLHNMRGVPFSHRPLSTVRNATDLSLDLAAAPKQTAKLYLIFGALLAVGLFLSR